MLRLPGLRAGASPVALEQGAGQGQIDRTRVPVGGFSGGAVAPAGQRHHAPASGLRGGADGGLLAEVAGQADPAHPAWTARRLALLALTALALWLCWLVARPVAVCSRAMNSAVLRRARRAVLSQWPGCSPVPRFSTASALMRSASTNIVAPSWARLVE